MATEFDYSAVDTPDEVIRSVAAEMSGGGLKPLSDDERLERAIWREEQAFLAEQRKTERERRQQEQEAIARQEAAAALVETNRRLRLERQRRDRELQREQQLVSLQIGAKFQQTWMTNAENAARAGLAQRQRQAILDSIDSIINPPQPPPEPEIVYVEPEEEVGICGIKPVRWR